MINNIRWWLGIALLFGAQVFAQQPTLDLGDASGAPGRTVAVPLVLFGNSACTNLQLDIVYDAATLTPATLTAGGMLGGHDLDWTIVAAGTLRVVIFSDDCATLDNGALINVPFSLAADAEPGNYPLTLSEVLLSDAQGEAIAPVTLDDGAITVLDIAPPPPPPPPGAGEPTPIPTLDMVGLMLLALALALVLVVWRHRQARVWLVLAGVLLVTGAPQRDLQAQNGVSVQAIVDIILGRSGFDPAADCNGDTVIDVRDIACLSCDDGEPPPGDNAPQLLPVGDRRIPLDQPFRMQLFAVDADPNEVLAFSLDSAPAGMTVSPAGGQLDWTPTATGKNTVIARVTDSSAQFDTATFTVTVHEPPPPVDPPVGPPTLAAIADQDLTVGETLVLSASAAPGTRPLAPRSHGGLHFSLPAAPQGMSIDPDTGQVNWTPSADQLGVHDVTVRVVEDTTGLAAAIVFVVTVRALNRPPLAMDDLYIARTGETLSIPAAEGLLINDSDPDAEQLGAVLVSGPSLGALDLDTDGSFDYTPTLSELDTTTEPTLRYSIGPHPQLGGLTATVMPVIADLTGDGVAEIVISAKPPGFGNRYLHAVDGATGDFLWSEYVFQNQGNPKFELCLRCELAVVDLDDDGTPEILGIDGDDGNPNANDPAAEAQIIAFEADGSVRWTSEILRDDPLINSTSGFTRLAAADLDGDRIPELLVGYAATTPAHPGCCTEAVTVYNADGTIRWSAEGNGSNEGLNPATGMVQAHDIDLDGRPEVLFGDQAWDVDGNLLWASGFRVIDLAVLNLDDDAFPEIVYLTAPSGHLVAVDHTGTFLWQTGTHVANGTLSAADLTGDGRPEIVLPDDDSIQVYHADGTRLWETTFPARTQGGWATVFDLDSDGSPELIYHALAGDFATGACPDQGTLYVLRGADGEVLHRLQVPRREAIRHGPLVADVTGDDHAEIVVAQYGCGGSTPAAFVFEAASGVWGRTRPIWNQNTYSITHVEPDGTVAGTPRPNWLTPGLNNHRVNVPLPEEQPLHSDEFRYRASDGALESNEATVFLEILPPGNPPRILSTPEPTGTVGALYRHRPIVFDPDVGDSFRFALSQAPTGMSIDPLTGLIRWTPTATGSHNVGLLVEDSQRFTAFQAFTIEVGEPVIVPDVVGQSEAQAAGTLDAADLRVGVISQRFDPAAVGTVLEQFPPPGSVHGFGAPVDLVVSLGPQPPGTGPQPPPPDMELAALIVEPSDATLLTGQSVQLIATGVLDGGTSRILTPWVSWSGSNAAASVNASGRVSAVSAGSATISATWNGVSGQATVTVAARMPDDSVAPQARIDSPASDSTVTEPVDILGTASDANFLRYTLDLAPAGTSDFIRIGESTTPVLGGVLGQLDPTVLINDLYTLRLSVFDRGDNVVVDEVTVQLDEHLKVGHFTLNFTDLAVPMAGIPITVTRSYDSRDKGQGEFGIGWRLDIQTLRLRTNRVLGTGWQVVRSGLSFGLVPTDAHKVSLTLPGGRVEEFDMVVSPNVSPLVPFPPFTQSARFQPRPGTLGTLESLDNNNVNILDPQPGAVELLDDVSNQVYNPQRYRYTTADGSAIVIHVRDGVESIRDPNGNTLTFGPGGITHSSGKSVVFQRDALNRITALTDPAGNVQTYTYDGNGDLIAHTDPEGHTTRFEYNRFHGLLRILDPLDRPLARNDYDENGRLIRTTSAEGRVIEFSHDLDNRQEVLTDADGTITVLEYDARGNVVRVTDPLGGVTVNTYDADGNQTSTTNPEGETITRTFDGRGNLLSETDPLGHTTRFAYNARDQRTSIIDPLGRITRFDYDARGNLTRRTNALGIVEQHNSYDSRGNRITRTDALGHTEQFEYDGFGNRTARIDARGQRESFAFDANGNLVGETDRRGQTLVTVVDARGLFTRKTDPLGNSVDFQYNALGVLEAISDAHGNTIRQELDAEGKEIARIDRLGERTEKTYDPKGNLTGITDPLGRTTTLHHDALDRRTRTILPDASSHTVEYDGAGRISTQIDARGNRTEFAYDAAGRTTRITDALGNVTTFGYDAAGNLIGRTDARGNTFTFSYDALDRRTRVTFPDGSFETTGYDARGQVISETDAAGHTTTFDYDANGNLIRVTDPLGGVTGFTYDAGNNLIAQTDANGHVTDFEYDANGRRIRKVYPDGGTVSQRHDALGNIVDITDANGDTTTFEYDARQRLTRKTFADGSTVAYTYTATDRFDTVTDGRGDTVYQYDALDRVIRIDNPDGSSLVYSYDAAGNLSSLTSRTSAGGLPRIVTYGYDALDRLSTVTEPDGSVTGYHYDANGNRSRVDYPNGTSTLYRYDELNRLTEIEHRRGAAPIERFRYTLNAVGDRIRVEQLDGRAVDYQYDALRRLIRETHRGPTDAIVFDVSYGYDAVGNRLERIDHLGGSVIAYRYDAADRLLGAGGNTFSYDANGNLRSRTQAGITTVYRYDAENRLVEIETATGLTSYSYDHLGNRIGRIDATGLVGYLVDTANNTGFAQVVEEYGPAGDRRVSYAYGDDLISQERNGQRHYYHYDGIHSTRLLTDASGAVTDTYSYEAFGSLLQRSGTTLNDYRYTGEQFDPNTGFYYLRARYYAPAQGRFLSRDPFEGIDRDPVSLHKYLYAHANPVNFRDPSGLLTLAENIVVGALSSILITSSIIIHEAASDPKNIASLTTGRIVFRLAISGITGAIGGAASSFSGFASASAGSLTGSSAAVGGFVQRLFEATIVYGFSYGLPGLAVGTVTGYACLLESAGLQQAITPGAAIQCGVKAAVAAGLYTVFGAVSRASGLNQAITNLASNSAASAAGIESLLALGTGLLQERISAESPSREELDRAVSNLSRGSGFEQEARTAGQSIANEVGL